MSSVHKNEKAFILGFTGKTGKNLLKLLLKNKAFKQLVLIGRREVDFGDDPLYENVEQKVVDFDKILDYKSAFEGCSVGFCCLGMPVGGALLYDSLSLSIFRDVTKCELYKIDHDYVVNCATIAKEAGCRSFSAISGQMANKDAWSFYIKIKGLMEEKLTKLGFDRLYFYRPAYILVKNENVYFAEWISTLLARPFHYFWPKQTCMTTEQLVKSVAWNACYNTEEQEKTIFVENSDVYHLAETYDKNVE